MSLLHRLQAPERQKGIQLTTNRRIMRALFSLISVALLLRLGGMLNQLVVSARFGAGATMDAYFVAAAFPFLLIQLISSAVEAAVIPVYSQMRLRSGEDEVSRLFSTLLNSLIAGSLCLTLLLLVLRRVLVLFSAPGFDAVQLNQAIALTPPLYLIVPVSLVIGLLECVLNAEGQFGWPAYAGLFVPLTTALLTWLGGRTFGVSILGPGILLGTLFQLGLVCFRARQMRLRYQLILDIRQTGFRRIMCVFWPVLLGALMSQGSPLVDQIFASLLPAGGVSALNYALKLVSIFSGVIFVSVGRALLPSLARQAAFPDPVYRSFKATLRLYIWGTALSVLVLSVLVLVLARPLVQVLFQHGAFSAMDTEKTVLTFSGFVVGLTPMALSFLLSRAFCALGATRVPMCVAFVCVGANAFLDALLAHFWQDQGIALATSAISILSCGILLIWLRRHIGSLHLYKVPEEWRAFSEHFSKDGRRAYGRRAMLDEHQRRVLFCTGIAVPVLALGCIVTAHDALFALRTSAGLLVVFYLLRYPFVLLLMWASVNIFIGSTLSVFNGNNLDMILVVPLLLCQGILPWKRIARSMPALIWFLLYLAWILSGIGLSPLKTSTFLTLWLTMLAYVAICALAIVQVRTRRRFYVLIDTLLTTGLLTACVGLFGYVTHQGGEIDSQTRLFRITSFFTQATTLAFYLSLLFPLAVYRCLFVRGIKKLVPGLVAFLLLAALLLTFTRSAYLSLLAGVLIIVLCLPVRCLRVSVLSGLVVLGGLTVFLSWHGDLPILARFFQGDVVTINGRIYLWQALLSRFQVTQWSGNGLQASDALLTYLRVGNLGQGVIGEAPHSLFLGTLYDHGVIGLVLLMLVLLTLGYGCLKGLRRSTGEQRMLYAVVLAAWISLLLQSLTSRDIWIQAVGIPFWIIASLPSVFAWSQSDMRLRTLAWITRKAGPARKVSPEPVS